MPGISIRSWHLPKETYREWRKDNALRLGAAATTFQFTIGKLIIGRYLGSSRIVSAYRAAGSPIVLFVWIYFSAQILFLGAEFTQVYARGGAGNRSLGACRVDREGPGRNPGPPGRPRRTRPRKEN